MDWRPFHTVPRDGTEVFLRGKWTPEDGVRVRYKDFGNGGGAWLTPENWLAIFDYEEWRPA